MTTQRKPRIWWIEFTGDLIEDKECYKRYVSGVKMDPVSPGDEVVKVCEILPGTVTLTNELANRVLERLKVYARSTHANSLSEKVYLELAEVLGKK